MTKNKQLILVITISLIQILFFWLPFFIREFSPKYYAGDPNFNLNEFYAQYGSAILPPKVLPSPVVWISFQIPILGFLWGMFWSIFTYQKRNIFSAYKIVVFSFIAYAITTFLFYGLAVLGGMGHAGVKGL